MTTGIFTKAGATEAELLALRADIRAALLEMAADGSVTVTTQWILGDKQETLRIIKDPEQVLDEIAYSLNVIDEDAYPLEGPSSSAVASFNFSPRASC